MKSFSLRLIIYALPFTYFWKTRLKGLKDWVFHSWNEWGINILILFVLLKMNFPLAIKSFLIGYTGFISFYEVGYIFNDFYSVKKEVNPRFRFGSTPISNFMLILWMIVRIAVFSFFLSFLNFNPDILLFYLGLGIVFALHNLLQNKGLKTFTFLQLALFRFWAPVIFFIPKEMVAILLPVVFLYYVFNRTLTYMDSKALLQLTERTSVEFRLNSCLILLVFTLFWGYFTQSWISLATAIYFLFFWIFIKVIGKRFSSTI